MDNESAFDIIANTLKFYGLVTDTDTRLLDEIRPLWTQKVIGPASTVDDIGIQLRDSAVFKERFPANALLAAQGKAQYSVSQYLQQEAAYKSQLIAAGMPTGFYDSPKDFQNWIANDVSPDEIGARIQSGYQAVRQADPQVVQEFQRLYGVSEGDLAAYFIDPERMRPTFDRYAAQRQARAAAVSAEATRQANLTLSQQQAESLVLSGITDAESARPGFQSIAENQELFQATAQERQAGEQNMATEEQIAGTFGTNAQARMAIASRRRRRQAAFEGSAGFGVTQTGVAGLRTAGD